VFFGLKELNPAMAAGEVGLDGLPLATSGSYHPPVFHLQWLLKTSFDYRHDEGIQV